MARTERIPPGDCVFLKYAAGGCFGAFKVGKTYEIWGIQPAHGWESFGEESSLKGARILVDEICELHVFTAAKIAIEALMC